MEKQDPFFELITDIITSSIQAICFLSPLAVFLAYFMFKDRVNTTTDFFLHWTSRHHRPKSHHDLLVRNLPTRP